MGYKQLQTSGRQSDAQLESHADRDDQMEPGILVLIVRVKGRTADHSGVVPTSRRTSGIVDATVAPETP
jgi:hypothetical protein